MRSRRLGFPGALAVLAMGLILSSTACSSSGATIETNQSTEEVDSAADVHVLIPHKQPYDGGSANEWTRRRHRPVYRPRGPIGPPPLPFPSNPLINPD
ncbi:MAG: hypothetical protein K0U98_00075 [Deltaproteobacteria bacterium]|nr:hypothetical protein [Deltaproteobacteria bacterium]